MKKSIYYIIVVILVSGCVNFKKQSLWDSPPEIAEPEHIENVYALNILEDGLNGDVWFTEDIKCIKVENSGEFKSSGEKGVHIKWDKQEGGCDWIGLGIGWDSWSGKDLSRILDRAAIQFRAYSPDGKIKSLPLAACLEDFGGAQAWLGITGNLIKYKGDDEWATVTLPLEDFSWNEFDADASNIKQMIIQFEAAGDFYVDDIKIVPFAGNTKYKYSILSAGKLEIKVDGYGNEQEWKEQKAIALNEDSEIKLLIDENFLYVSGAIMDKTPAQNSKSGDDIWNGDALEIAFSTSSEANKKRKKFLFSDQQIGIRMNDLPMVWDWRGHKEIPGTKTVVIRNATSYFFESKIPLSYFTMEGWQLGKTYGLEVALDKGNASARLAQIRWNSPEVIGFHKNPSLWGEMVFISQDK